MMTTVAQMTTAEFRDLLEEVIEQKLLELLADPDQGWILQAKVRNQLLQQQQATAAGERGQPLDSVVQQLGLE
jgi:uncharacterized protein involved in cysteine biosynthesis